MEEISIKRGERGRDDCCGEGNTNHRWGGDLIIQFNF